MAPPEWPVRDGVASEPTTLPPGAQADSGISKAECLNAADLPAQFGRYRIERKLGQGGMGAVYQAYDTVLGRTVALKVPFLGGDLIKARFLREAQAAAALAHPNLCPIHDLGEIGGVPFLTMALIQGEPLSRRIGPHGLEQARSAAFLVRKLALALEQAHQAGVIHRDLKPSNILMDDKGEPVITDFGLARRADVAGALTQSGQLLGTPAYMSPEQFNAEVEHIGPASDIYSLGVILYELLTGKTPFAGDLLALACQVTTMDPVPPSRWRPGLDPDLERICLRALAKKLADRWPSMQVLAETLGGWLERMAAFAGLQGGRSNSPASLQGEHSTSTLSLHLEGSSFLYRPAPGQQVITLGRQKRKPGMPDDQGNDIVLRVPGDDEFTARISRRHLEIHRRATEFYVIDRSKGGTLRNQEPLPRDVPVLLAHGDQLLVAGVMGIEVLLSSPTVFRAAPRQLRLATRGHGRAEVEVSVGDMVTVD